MCRFILLFSMISLIAKAMLGQEASISGQITSEGEKLPYSHIVILGTKYASLADSTGKYQIENLPLGEHTIRVSSYGYSPFEEVITLKKGENIRLNANLKVDEESALEEVVISGTMKEVQRLESPVPVEVYNPTFFRRNPTPNIFDALQNVNGVRPQLNCNVCNTGDIHINGLEGPYTMVLLDGMPIVSGLSTVYGLSGIPNSLIQRVEIVKGPASSLYGSESVGGLINIITKSPEDAPLLSADAFGTSWQEYNLDLGLKLNLGKKASILTGVNAYWYDNPIDNNADNFTDVSLQKRISIFQKWNFKRKSDRLFSLAGRYFYEDRWGGEMQWTPQFRGGDNIYGESIYTRRWEFVGKYQLPTTEKLMLSFSLNFHDQNSVYGDLPYLGQQNIGFTQLTWDKSLPRHELLAGLALRYTYYDDNTTATRLETVNGSTNKPEKVWLPGIFLQDEIQLKRKHKLLLGTRYDHHSKHGNIFTPRLAYRWKLDQKKIFRVNAGTGFRAVSLFTEDHAALTGAREVVISEKLNPERSYNANVNYLQKVFTPRGNLFSFDLTAFYTYFTNQILPDYDSDPNLIIYDNLDGHSVSSGITANVEAAWANSLRITAGATLMDNYAVENGEKFRPILNERFNAVWSISYTLPSIRLMIDYTANLYGPMRLPLLSELDPRDEYSPTWSLQNIQLTYTSKSGKWNLYGGVKNLLNYTPPANSIARSFDPFDKAVEFDSQGQVIPTANNPYALTFDPAYVYAPNQGVRGFLGIRLRVE
jgi:outer membrane receptor for ferrienterochelin and colicins